MRLLFVVRSRAEYLDALYEEESEVLSDIFNSRIILPNELQVKINFTKKKVFPDGNTFFS